MLLQICRSVKHVVRLAALAGAVLTIAAAQADYPKPAPVPYRWELEFDAGPLRLYHDQSSDAHYWYFTYTVINRTGSDQLWAPKFTLYTDVGEIMDSGRDVSAQVVENLMSLLGNELLEDQNEAIGDLLQGKENAKEGLVIWPAKNLEVTELSLFVAGISGETARVKHPVNGQEIILRKSLQRDYIIRGSATARGSEPIELLEQRWVLR
jgi:hypothetical protein